MNQDVTALHVTLSSTVQIHSTTVIPVHSQMSSVQRLLGLPLDLLSSMCPCKTEVQGLSIEVCINRRFIPKSQCLVYVQIYQLFLNTIMRYNFYYSVIYSSTACCFISASEILGHVQSLLRDYVISRSPAAHQSHNSRLSSVQWQETGSSFRLNAANRRCHHQHMHRVLVGTVNDREMSSSRATEQLRTHPHRHGTQFNRRCDSDAWSAVTSSARPTQRSPCSFFLSAFCAAVSSYHAISRADAPDSACDVIVTSRCVIMMWCVDVVCGNIGMHLCRGILPLSLWSLNGSIIHNKTFAVNVHQKTFHLVQRSHGRRPPILYFNACNGIRKGPWFY